MKEVLEAIERHLGRSLSISELDYYQVIGLDLYCNDPQQIRRALQDATNRWMQSETNKYPASAQIVGKLLKQAQAILLDPQKRERYDAQLVKLRASQAEPPDPPPAVGAARTAEAASSADDGFLFPTADPMAPFVPDPEAWQTAHRASACTLLEQIHDPQTRLAELEQLFPSLAELDAMQPAALLVDPFVKQATAPKLSTAGGVSLAEQLRQKRRRKQMLLGGGMILGAVVLLGASVWAYMNNRNRIANKDTNPAPQLPNPANAGKGVLPEVNKDRDDGDDESPSGKKPRNDRRKDRGKGKDKKPVVSDLPSVQRSEEDSSMPMADTTPMAAKSTVTDMEVKEPPADNPEMDKPATDKPAEPPAIMTETQEWKNLMAAARTAIDKADFKTFEAEIAKATPEAKSPAGRDQVARLDQLGQLYKIATESFEEAKRKARGTSSIKVGPTEYSIVETTPEKIIVRVAGKNQSHPWDKLPFGIAAALFDLSLSTTEPTDIAARATYFSLAPTYRDAATKSELLKKRIDDWFEKSQGKGQVRTDLRQALTDSYE